MIEDIGKAFESILHRYRDQGGTLTNASEIAALRELERMIRNDECEEIMAGFRAYGRATIHDYLEKRIAKRK